MKNTVKINSVELINADSLHYVATLPHNSIDLIVADPPYFKVKPNCWDNQWKGDEDYLRWLDSCLAEYARVLKPAGSIYLFCGHRLASDIEIMMRARFNVLNHIIWAKPSGRWNGCNKESLRAYFPSTERILFAEHYLGPYTGKEDVYERKSTELKQHIMTPLIDYFRNARESLGDGTARGTVEEIEGFVQTVTPDARSKDTLSENAVTVDIAVSYYRQSLDGRELFAIDTERFARRVNGVDVLSGLAAKVRL